MCRYGVESYGNGNAQKKNWKKGFLRAIMLRIIGRVAAELLPASLNRAHTKSFKPSRWSISLTSFYVSYSVFRTVSTYSIYGVQYRQPTTQPQQTTHPSPTTGILDTKKPPCNQLSNPSIPSPSCSSSMSLSLATRYSVSQCESQPITPPPASQPCTSNTQTAQNRPGQTYSIRTWRGRQKQHPPL